MLRAPLSARLRYSREPKLDEQDLPFKRLAAAVLYRSVLDYHAWQNDKNKKRSKYTGERNQRLQNEKTYIGRNAYRWLMGRTTQGLTYGLVASVLGYDGDELRQMCLAPETAQHIEKFAVGEWRFARGIDYADESDE